MKLDKDKIYMKIIELDMIKNLSYPPLRYVQFTIEMSSQSGKPELEYI